MKPSNAERNSKVHDLWVLGQTIDQISMSTGIPRSTVGYYVRKFKRSERGRPFPRSVTQTSSDASPFESIVTKTYFFQQVLQLIVDRDFQKLHYFLLSYRTLMQMQSYLKLTKDEGKLFQNTISDQSKQKVSVGTESTKRGKTLEEILDRSSNTPSV